MSSGNIIGKNKIMVTDTSYGALPGEEWWQHGPGIHLRKNPATGYSYDDDNPVKDQAQGSNSVNHLASNAGSPAGLFTQDRLRCALGASWSNRSSTPRSLHHYPDGEPPLGWSSDPHTEYTFDNLRGPWKGSAASTNTPGGSYGDKYRVFYGKTLGLIFCSDKTSLSGAPQGLLDPNPNDSIWETTNAFWLHNNVLTTRTIEITAKIEINESPTYSYWWPRSDESEGINRWHRLIRDGKNMADGTYYPPIVDDTKVYKDHYHECSYPFTKSEIKNNNITGKSLMADVTTYYDSVMGYSGGSGGATLVHPDLQSSVIPRFYENSIAKGGTFFSTCLPNIYGFLSLINGEFDLEKFYSQISGISHGSHPDGYHSPDYADEWYPFVRDYPFEMLITLGGLVDKTAIQSVLASNPNNTAINSYFEDYFNNLAYWFSTSKSSPDVSEEDFNYYKKVLLESKFKNIIFSSGMMPIMSTVDKYKKYFPFYSELQFSTQTLTGVGDMMGKMLQTSLFATKIAESNSSNVCARWHHQDSNDLLQFPNSAVIGSFVNHYQQDVYSDFSTATPVYSSGDLVTSTNKVYDIFSILAGQNGVIESDDYYTAPGIETQEERDSIKNFTAYLRDEKSESSTPSELNNAIRTFLGKGFASYLVKKYKENYRDYEDILKGVPAYTEDVFYRIEKWEKFASQSDDEWKHVSNTIVPNTSDLNLFKYVDTQVKYGGDTQHYEGTVYRYNVYVYRLVFGAKYKYMWPGGNPIGKTVTSQNQTDFATYHATCDVLVAPDLVMIEDLYFASPIVSVLDSPPPPPQVNIVPFRAVDNKLLFMMNGSVDTYQDHPISILSADDSAWQKVRESQLTSTEIYVDPLSDGTYVGGPKIQASQKGKVKFSSDDVASSFQIFRSSTPPKSYRDFDLYVDNLNENTFIEENIFPNRKYYYTFRSIDSHGHMSNPTAIYEVELISEQGAVKPKIKHYMFPEHAAETPAKGCQKYIYIKPSLKQIYSKEKTEDLDYMFTEPPYGDADGVEDPNSKRRFKIRLTSKSTGKKIDLNVAFVKKAHLT